jgi:hypothetical protein
MEDTSTAATAPPMNVLLCLLTGIWPLLGARTQPVFTKLSFIVGSLSAEELESTARVIQLEYPPMHDLSVRSD